MAGEKERPAALSEERAYYAAHVAEWQREHRGEYVVVKGSAHLGFYPSDEAALGAGAAAYGLTSFLVQRIGEPPVLEVSAPALTLGILGAHP